MKRYFLDVRRSLMPRLLGACATLLPLVAAACPLCDTETGQQVRAGIFNDEFWRTLFVVISPFPILLLAIAAYHFDWPPFGSRPASHTQITPPTNGPSV
jgi:hypothetical protein